MSLANKKTKEISISNGFVLCAITKIHNISEHQKHIEEWVSNNHNGNMDWFNINNDIRSNPQLLVPNAKSVIVCAKSYNPKPEFGLSPKIAKYALGVDYHYTTKSHLTDILTQLKVLYPDINGEIYCDSAPLLERYWAERSGIGWVGKNGLITTSQYGSMITLGFIITDKEFDQYDTQIESKCANCSKCLEACPTGAIGGRTMDARKCLSYLTIEHKGKFSDSQSEIVKTKSGNTFFGCDICIDACPWNKKSIQENVQTHKADDKFIQELDYWQNLSSHRFNKYYRNTPLQRAGVHNIRRNIQTIFGPKDKE